MDSPSFGDAFILATEAVFLPLELEYGFRRCAPHVNLELCFFQARYERDADHVVLSACPVRLELDLCVGTRTSDTERKATLQEMRNLGQCDVPSGPRYGIYELYESPDVTRLRDEFSASAHVLFQCGRRFLERDTTFWRDIEHRRALERQHREREELAMQAETAFKRGDWAAAIGYLEGLEPHLTPLQAGRLNFARGRLRRQ